MRIGEAVTAQPGRNGEHPLQGVRQRAVELPGLLLKVLLPGLPIERGRG
jgi:hypothetical protein